MAMTTFISRIFRKQSAKDNHVSDNSYRVSGSALHSDISVTSNSVVKPT